MGAGLFERFPEQTRLASEVLGYSIEELCLTDPRGELARTEFTQPALYVVNALTFLARQVDGKPSPDFLAGHSLGEYNALMAAGVFDFQTGLRLVQKRGALMSQMRGGAMAAVIGMKPDRISELLFNFAFDSVDIANFNSPTQTVISGAEEELRQAVVVLKEAGATVIPLKVSGAFHSRLMKPAQKEFADFLEPFTFAAPAIPVVANATAAFYEPARLKETLAQQIASGVRWVESVQLLLNQGEAVFEETGPGNVLTKLIRQIREAEKPA
jgi:trans-AT polyketide synthase/acyltransferase/oxidoreductase domain-containing protein